ncbi:MAG: hypothetical protein AAGK78_09875, partial [Planctomycetota bacterium]
LAIKVLEAAGNDNRLAGQRPVLGEWYHSFAPFDNDVARHVGLPGDKCQPGAWAYVVELKNPHPDREVKALRLTSDPTRDATAIVLGVSIVTP